VSDARRFLILSWDGGGNTPPAFNLGAHLVRRGHAVRLLGWPPMAGRAAAAGVEFAPYASVPPFPPDVDLDDVFVERVQQALSGAATKQDILDEARGFAADVIVVDCMIDAGLDAARTLGLPTAVLFHILYSLYMHVWGDPPTLAERWRVFEETDLVLALVPPGFDEPCAVAANTSYVGPINAPASGTQLDSRDASLLAEPGDPWVLLSLSTTVHGQVNALPRLLEALSTLAVRVLLTLGGAVPTGAVEAPANVTVRDYIPHDLVLPRMAAVVSHGGLSTVTAALTAGVPLVCVPQGRDQSDNARRVEATGVGKALGADAPASAIASALQDLLADPAPRRAARRFADVIDGLGAGDVAVDKVEALGRPS
jgi:UDP:flavonoid glycosyltransferase YjiC (YdhE family)